MRKPTNRYRIRSMSTREALIGYVVFDCLTHDEFHTITVSSELPADRALQQARVKCAELNRSNDNGNT